jgi:F420-0:gamma-glutamyl ligase
VKDKSSSRSLRLPKILLTVRSHFGGPISIITTDYVRFITGKTVEGAGIVGAVVGNDFAGTVDELGPGVDATEFKVGDRVASFVHGGKKFSSHLF